jgi:hypothetical protein
MSQPKKSMTESVLARAELYRRGLMFEGVPALGVQAPLMPALEAPQGAPAPAPGQQAAPAQPGVTDALVAGAVAGKQPLETLLQP